MSDFSGFYKKTRQERIRILADKTELSEETCQILEEDRNLPETVAGKMAENHLGTFSLPFSVVPEFTVNDYEYRIPIVTEEPSVVAACSFGAKIIAKSGGFTTSIEERLMIGQVALYDVVDMEKARAELLENSQQIISLANQAHPSIVKRGGGARKISVEIKEQFLILYLHVDVQEAMGANILNTMLEGIKDYLENVTAGKSLMAILSNYATDSLVTASCRIKISSLHTDPALAQETAEKLALASKLAQVDPYRAATHNKGIFNGIDALVVATGNDWRAVEAGSHAYASRDGIYRGLSTWTIDGEALVGSLTLPMPIATVGGSIGLNPKVQVAFDLLGHPDARTLAGLIVSVGLCQNFAALRALVTSGIQQGHMKLHAKSLAMLAGAIENEIEEVARLLRQEKHMNLETAEKLLTQVRTP
ncbi:hydroxymethylglutaryl-CoA reductase, degradative [Streptococcus gallolyticus]|uniref:hydroxymethylglutaryl-CoA reductase, degradative n=1 Tax=Streptococcus hepaticus TaxID=3349163 RepID=UPI001C987045|nr:hydroxymethylglutaryl-CoA reductase, degradative [Streptococcus gallolyticus]MBY5040097.1 hydroxymethylglutaryl-CoA reductase, degradative [Streptococcus gallolyticus]